MTSPVLRQIPTLILAFILLAGAASQGHAKAKFTPIGFVLANASFNSGAANNNDIPFYAVNDAGLSKSTWFAGRQARIGIKAQPDTSLPVYGVVEVDFITGGSGFRLAYIDITISPTTKIIFGQHWSLFAPLHPTSIAHQAIAPLTKSGNLWTRTPQLRIEHKKESLFIQAALQTPASRTGQSGIPDMVGRLSRTFGPAKVGICRICRVSQIWGR